MLELLLRLDRKAVAVVDEEPGVLGEIKDTQRLNHVISRRIFQKRSSLGSQSVGAELSSQETC